MGLMQTLALYWQYPFVRSALAVGVLIALCASLLGCRWCCGGFPLSGTGCPTRRSGRWRWPRC